MNLAFFGDSFTENQRLPAQYSFTEPLDYLLNRGGRRFNVLNFGVDGYGTDQSFLYYRSLEYASQLDYVFYIFSANDLRNIYENNLFTLDESGNLVGTVREESPWWIALLSRLHVTYVVLDGRQRLLGGGTAFDGADLSDEWIREQYEEHEERLREQYLERFHSPRASAISESLYDEKENEDLARSIAIFNALLRQWRALVEDNGGRFYIVVLPKGKESRASRVIDGEYDVINFYDIFNAAYEDFDYDDVRFHNDGHWNEEGNFLAARHLYLYVERAVNLPPMSLNRLDRELYTYYAAFPGGWMPPLQVDATPVAADELARIREEYLALELEALAAPRTQ